MKCTHHPCAIGARSPTEHNCANSPLRKERRHSYTRPVDDGARWTIECEILGQLGQRQDLDVAAEDVP